MNKTFYGRINDKEYTDQQEFLKDLQQLQEVSNVVYKYTETPTVESTSTSVQPDKTEEDRSTQSMLQNLFIDFTKNAIEDESSFARLKTDIIRHFNHVDDELIEQDLAILKKEMNSLRDSLVKFNDSCNHNKNVLAKEQYQLEKLNKQLVNIQRLYDEQLKKVDSLQYTCDKGDRGLVMWEDLYNFMEDTSKEVQQWVDENLVKEIKPEQPVCEKCGKKCDECQCKASAGKPDWMSQGYYNLLKEIFG